MTHRKARLPRRADLTSEGYARLSYRQTDTLWKGYTPDWDLHQLRHTAISVRAAHDLTDEFAPSHIGDCFSKFGVLDHVFDSQALHANHLVFVLSHKTIDQLSAIYWY